MFHKFMDIMGLAIIALAAIFVANIYHEIVRGFIQCQ